jgi:hypothetical protein
MTITVASDALTRERRDTEYYRSRGLEAYRTYYFGRDEVHDGPQGFLVEIPTPAGVITPHFHRVDQFQVFVGGGGTIGKHRIEPVTVHYSDGYTPYGPIVSGDDGIVFFNLRSGGDTGTHEMPESREQLIRRAGRALTARVALDDRPDRAATETVLEPTEDGVAAFALRLPPGVELEAPAPDGGGGQFHVVLNGAVVHDGGELPPRSALWLDPADPPAAYRGGAGGADVLVVQFPARDRG